METTNKISLILVSEFIIDMIKSYVYLRVTLQINLKIWDY